MDRNIKNMAETIQKIIERINVIENYIERCKLKAEKYRQLQHAMTKNRDIALQLSKTRMQHVLMENKQLHEKNSKLKRESLGILKKSLESKRRIEELEYKKEMYKNMANGNEK